VADRGLPKDSFIPKNKAGAYGLGPMNTRQTVRKPPRLRLPKLDDFARFLPSFRLAARVPLRAALLFAFAATPALLPAAETGDAPNKKTSRTATTAQSVPLPDYPQVNLARGFEVVKNWPQRPRGAERGAIPSIAIHKDGNIWIHSRANPMVQVYAPDGRYLRGWMEEDKRAVPHGISFDAEGNVWLVDVGLHNLRKFTPDGKLLLTVGVTGQPGADAGHFNRPTGVAFAPNGEIFVADGYGNSRIVHLDSDGRFIKAWGTLGVEPGNFSLPHAIACDSKGRLYVADRNNVRIQVFDANGKLLDVWPSLLTPWNFHLTDKDELWVCGSSPMQWTAAHKHPALPLGCPPKDQVLARFDTTGRMLELHTFPKGEDHHEQAGDLNWFHAVALDHEGNLFAGDIIGKRVQKFARKR
jgi:sugar lactone lactonase YvrE